MAGQWYSLLPLISEWNDFYTDGLSTNPRTFTAAAGSSYHGIGVQTAHIQTLLPAGAVIERISADATVSTLSNAIGQNALVSLDCSIAGYSQVEPLPDVITSLALQVVDKLTWRLTDNYSCALYVTGVDVDQTLKFEITRVDVYASIAGPIEPVCFWTDLSGTAQTCEI